MKSAMCAERKFWKEFINLYKTFPALWDVKNEQYKNKETKDKCYNVLVQKMKMIEPNADQSTVRKKINILRTNFRRELNRVNSSNTKPSLWYFEDMMFTLCNDEMRKDVHISTCTSGTEIKHEVDTFDEMLTHFGCTKTTDSILNEAKENKRKSVKKIKVLKVHKKLGKRRFSRLKREYWTNFIKLYESFPALWKTNSQEYKDRKLKEECYEVLVNKLRQIEPDADRVTVRKKINTLRCNFRREQNRIRRTQCSSKLWYYNSMAFLNDQENPSNEKDESVCDSDDDMDIKPDVECEVNVVETSVQQNEAPIPVTAETVTNHMEEIEVKSEVDTISDHLIATSKNLFEPTSSMVNKMAKGGEDEIDLQGKIWAAEFRKLIPEQQLFAKKAIDDILFERRLAGIVQSQNK